MKKPQFRDGVFIGLFDLLSTHGVPLSLAIHILVERQIQFSIPHFVLDAAREGWATDKIRSTVRSAWSDHVGPSEVRQLEQWLEPFISIAENQNKET
jgi:hypothetical protein